MKNYLHISTCVPNSRTAQRGMAFIATMMVLFLVMATILIGVASLNSHGVVSGGSTGNGLMSTINNGLSSANTRMNQAQAFDLAESGLEYTCEWLSEQGSPPSSLTAFTPSGWGQFPGSSSSTHTSISYGTGSFSILLYPLSTNQNGSDMGYLVESQGTANGGTVTLQAYVSQTNFGHYAYFTNYDDPSGWWVVGLNSFNGPMHSNDTNTPGPNYTFTPTNILWYNNKTTNPMFQYLGNDAYTVSAPTIDWNVNNIGTKTSPTSASNWSNIAAGGSSTVQTNTSVVALPTASSLEQNAAWGGSTGQPTSSSPYGATIPHANGATDAGIYVHGTIQNMTLSVSNNTTQIIQIQQTDPNRSSIPAGNQAVNTTITINQSTNTTSISTQYGVNGPLNPPVTASYTGTTNGVVYADSNIGTNTNSSSASGGLSGTIADSYTNSSGVTSNWGLTIATAASANTNIDGSIVYNTQPTSSNFSTTAGTFGLVSNVVDVTTKTAGGANNSAVTIDGAVMAYNTFQAANYGENFTGTFNLYGSYIAYNAGTFGEVTLAGALTNGLAESYSYDNRLGIHPPPFFPTTGNTYTIQSWKMANAELQSP